MTTIAQTKALTKYDIIYDGGGYIIVSKFLNNLDVNVYASEGELEYVIEAIADVTPDMFETFCEEHEFGSFEDIDYSETM
jgi:hypothetical protein